MRPGDGFTGCLLVLEVQAVRTDCGMSGPASGMFGVFSYLYSRIQRLRAQLLAQFPQLSQREVWANAAVLKCHFRRFFEGLEQ